MGPTLIGRVKKGVLSSGAVERGGLGGLMLLLLLLLSLGPPFAFLAAPKGCLPQICNEPQYIFGVKSKRGGHYNWIKGGMGGIFVDGAISRAIPAGNV